MRAALDLSQGRGLVAVNVMKAVRDHPALVRQACESGAHAIVMGAGLPMDLPEMTADHPKVSLIPILSEARGAVVLKKWLKKGRMADAVVIEHPGHAGGHLGAAKLEDARRALRLQARAGRMPQAVPGAAPPRRAAPDRGRRRGQP